MDLGFAGLIEKIEERFGSKLTDVLILMLFLLVCAWVIQTLVGSLVWSQNAIESGGVSFWYGTLARIVILMLPPALVFFLGNIWMERKLTRFYKQRAAKEKEVFEQIENTSAELQQWAAELKKQSSETQDMDRQLLTRINHWKDKFKRAGIDPYDDEGEGTPVSEETKTKAKAAKDARTG